MSDTTFEWNDSLACEFAGFLEHRLKYNSPSDIPSILYLFKENKRLEKKWESEELDKNSEQRPWQILTFGDKRSTVKWHLNVQGGYGSMDWSLQDMLSDRNQSVASGHLFIESVRRNSDGEVFTINDSFTANAGCTLTIKGFAFKTGNLKVNSVEYGYWDISSIKKLPPKLFTTTDGVDIFPGMPYWSVDPDFTIFFSGGAGDGSGTEPGRKYFSTDAAATQYAWDNKPIWSRKDFREIIRVLEEKITLKNTE